MNKFPIQNDSKNTSYFEDEIFDDSSFLAKFENTSFKTPKHDESTINDSRDKSFLNVSALCCDEEISGYDKLTGKTWIYPTNYPVRDYQFNIIKNSILKNTLVSLPTGLGKTFIAAVIMYNFYRWYPLGKIIFTAPTRPLVAQQIDACYNIIAIPPNDTIEMTGHMQVNTRKTHWQSKRVFFATPQVIYNDIKSGICPGNKIRCLVIDEAHRAKGNYAYCQIVSTLTEIGHKTYRILALSATPGSKVEDVVSVIKTLQIAHLELRTENCIDVAPYSHSRKINTIIIPLGPELTQLRQQYIEILDCYARRLKQFNILPQNLGNLSKGRVVMLYKEFQSKERGARHPQHNNIMKDFTLLISLCHGLELLVKHGSRVFLNFFDEHPEKSWIQSDDRLTALLERLRDDLGINPLSLNRSILPDGTIPEIPKDICFGHPKFYKLKEVMMEHFTAAKKKGQDTRAIVFCEYRESVNLVHCLLLQCRPLIMPQMFVGQGASGKDGKTVVSQKQQLRVMRSFREGASNVLVATCVAEEGLDVGSVDLIVCFDISTRSPVRLVQRCGRTGRERGGQVFILVTEGREHQTLLECMRQRDGLNTKILQSAEVNNNLYKQNPRMMPHDYTPQCQKMFITVAKKIDPKEKVKDTEKNKRNQKDLRSMLLSKTSSSSSTSSKEFEGSEMITEEEFNNIFPQGFPYKGNLEKPIELWSMNKEKIKAFSEADNRKDNLITWLEWQRTLQKTINIGHSKDTEILTELLQYGDAKRFDLPASTQNPTFNTQDFVSQNTANSPVKVKPTKLKKNKVVLVKSPIKATGKKDGDIRALFSTATKSTKNYTKLINDLGIQNNEIPTKLINLLVDLSLESGNAIQTCYICKNVCDCTLFNNIRQKNKKSIPLNFITDPILPDIDLINEINEESLLNCVKYDKNNVDEDKPNDPNCSTNNNNFDLDFDFSTPDEINSSLKPKTPEKTKITGNDVKVSNNFELELDFESLDESNVLPVAIDNKIKDKNDTESNFEIGDIEDIFCISSPEEVKVIEKVKEKTEEKAETQNEALGFFGLDSIDDIFADYDDSIESKPKPTVALQEHINTNPEKPKENVVSPSILSGRSKTFMSTSPILCSQNRKFQLSTKKTLTSTPASVKARRQLIKDPTDVSSVNKTEQRSNLTANSLQGNNSKSMFTITQLVDMINKSDNEKSISNIENHDRPSKVDGDRSMSPILLTQADKIKTSLARNSSQCVTTQNKKSESLIILDSDSDDSTEDYEVNSFIKVSPKGIKNKVDNVSNINCKRKHDDDDDDFMAASPYFNKKPKLENNNNKPLTLQEKVLAALTSNKFGDIKPNNDRIVNFCTSPIKCLSEKENKNPQFLENKAHNSNPENGLKSVNTNKIELLQRFRRDSKIRSPIDKGKCKYTDQKQIASASQGGGRIILFDDSDDDFVDDKPQDKSADIQPKRMHKIRKKKKNNSFLELEAELSGDGSGDELSDDSVGSIVDFICDDNDITHQEDMHAHYIRSVKSPVKGVFKIPELPNKYNKMNVFSQYVEEDAYEMDSFCVDSHIGLTQNNEMSELEIAEIVLKERKKKKRKPQDTIEENGDSPVIKRRNKVVRQIESDSDDSS